MAIAHATGTSQARIPLLSFKGSQKSFLALDFRSEINHGKGRGRGTSLGWGQA
jgi:hypothetical protein